MTVNEQHLHPNERGIRMIANKPFRWTKDSAGARLRLVPVTAEEMAAAQDQEVRP